MDDDVRAERLIKRLVLAAWELDAADIQRLITTAQACQKIPESRPALIAAKSAAGRR